MSYRVGMVVRISLNEHFYRDSDGNGRGWPISKVYDDEYAHFTINYVAPGKPKPIHLHGKYGDLGWVSPSAITVVISG